MHSQSTIGCVLFLYREELNRSKSRGGHLCRLKIFLTDKLVSQNFNNLKSCSMDDLKAIQRELMYKKRLQNRLIGKKKMSKLAAKNPKDSKDSLQKANISTSN